MNPTIEVIRQLRQESGAGVMDCRKALEQFDLDYPRALDYLRERAAAHVRKQNESAVQEGRIEVYSHGNGRIGVMVEIGTQTEFASRSQVLCNFAHEIALHITSAAPQYVRDEDIPAATLAELETAALAKAHLAGKPEKLHAQIVAGAQEKFRNQYVLLRQAYLRDETLTIAQLLNRVSSQVGEAVVIRRFTRWEICPAA